MRRRPSAVADAVAQAAHGLDQAAAQLAAQAGHVHFQRIALHLGVGAQHQAFEVGLGDDAAGTQHQGLHQGPLARGQLHPLPAPGAVRAARSSSTSPKACSRPGAHRHAPAAPPAAAPPVRPGEGLDQVVVGTGVQACTRSARRSRAVSIQGWACGRRAALAHASQSRPEPSGSCQSTSQAS
jgi:hypothetical protein